MVNVSVGKDKVISLHQYLSKVVQISIAFFIPW